MRTTLVMCAGGMCGAGRTTRRVFYAMRPDKKEKYLVCMVGLDDPGRKCSG